MKDLVKWKIEELVKRRDEKVTPTSKNGILTRCYRPLKRLTGLEIVSDSNEATHDEVGNLMRLFVFRSLSKETNWFIVNDIPF